jgi:arylsulfatase
MDMHARPNILLVTTDQHRGDCIGIERSEHPVMTPHMDQLAREGVRFDRAYSDCPMCIPARKTIMTGRAAYSHGVAKNAAVSMPAEPHLTLPGRLTAEGYQTHAAGKMHFHPARARSGFERMRLHPDDYVNWLEKTPYAGTYRGHGLGGNEVYPTFSATPAEYTHTHWIVEESIDFLRQRDPEHPFFLWTCFESPHTPYDPPERFVRYYDGVEIPKPASGAWSATEDEVPYWVRMQRWMHKFDLLPEHVVATARKHYYASLTQVDYELGRLFGELKMQGLWENTIILLTSDHGDMLGDHGLFQKSCFYEPSARIPFLLRIPEHLRSGLSPGSSIHEAVQLADIYPTLLGLAGCSSGDGGASGRDGVDLMALLDQPQTQRRWIFGYSDVQDGMYMATNGEWKYLYYVCGGREQLFHVDKDPAECVNLADDADYGEIVAAGRSRLAEQFPELALAAQRSASGLKMSIPHPVDENEVRALNPYAWKGPMRYGSGH